VKPVAPGDEVAVEALALAVVLEKNVGSVGVEVVDADFRGLEQYLTARGCRRSCICR
jgi:hypothetical protein